MRLSRAILLGAAALLLGAGVWLGLASWQEMRGGQKGSAPSQHGGHAMSEQAQSPNAQSQQAMPGMPATQPAGKRKILYWYDPMHPSYHSDKPGIAPDCGMKLVPRYADEAEAMKSMPPGTVMLSAEKQQMIGVRTTQVRRAPLERTIRTVGRIEPDDTRIARIHVKIAGWVDKVYVDYVGKLVKKGEPLFTVYSPELVSTQQEYLIARRGQKYLGDSPYPEVATGAESLFRAARDRLLLWDISEAQIQQLDRTGQVQRTMTLYSPIDGFVMSRNVYEQVRVTPDTDLYEIADLSRIWVYVDVYEYEVPYVRVGQPVSMQLSYYPGKTYRGKVDYVYPTLDPKTRTVRVRLAFPNPDFDLKPGMFADAELKIDYGVQTLIPREALLDSGTRQIVFIAKPGGYFEPRQVEVGARFDDQVVVLRGLQPGETVVASGNFLIDSESRLTSATGGMSHSH
jgi:Cu(I)/Ag(I) efflux system membrane fusion protein